MFSLFKKPRVVDPVLGELLRSRGSWRGAISVEGGPSVLLVLPGTGAAPDARAISIVQHVDDDLPRWRADIAKELFDHLEPYAQEVDPARFGHIKSPEEVWPHVRLVHVAVSLDHDELTLELGYQADWDEEHTLGVFFCNGKLLHLNGSVGTP
jgi:hypothetical protein